MPFFGKGSESVGRRIREGAGKKDSVEGRRGQRSFGLLWSLTKLEKSPSRRKKRDLSRNQELNTIMLLGENVSRAREQRKSGEEPPFSYTRKRKGGEKKKEKKEGGRKERDARSVGVSSFRTLAESTEIGGEGLLTNRHKRGIHDPS